MLGGVAAVALVVLGRVAVSRGLGLWAAAIVSVAAWITLSIAWTESIELSVLEAERALVYVAAAVAFAVLLRADASRAVRLALLVALAAVAVRNLAHRAASDEGLIGEAAAPIGYENGLAFLASAGVVLALGFALAREHVGFRILAAATLTPFAAVLVVAYSRGAWLALAVGAAAAVAARERPRLLPAVVVAGLVVAHAGAFVGDGERPGYWRVALGAWADQPLLGGGAGTFLREWLRERDVTVGARDAHGLYVETLAELGALGLVIVVVALSIPFAVAFRRRGSGTAIGVYAAFVVHAAADWDWEQPAVTLTGLAAGAVALAERSRSQLLVGARTRAAALAGVVAVTGLAAAAYRGNSALAASDEALRRGDASAAEASARVAERWQPWSAEPWQRLARAQLADGRRADALASLRRAAEHDAGDPYVWREYGEAAAGAERRRALERARRLDPRGTG